MARDAAGIPAPLLPVEIAYPEGAYREALSVFLSTVIEPLAAITGREFTVKSGHAVTLDCSKLRASEIAPAARAVRDLTALGVYDPASIIETVDLPMLRPIGTNPEEEA